MESTETISPPQRSARRRATADLPTAVGPAIKRGPGAGGEDERCPPVTIVCCRASGLRDCRPPKQEGKEDHARGKNSDTDQVGGREPAVEVPDRIIASKQLDERPGQGVRHQVGGKDL